MSTLKSCRQSLNLTIDDVSNDTGIPRSTLSRIENSKQLPNRDHARTLYEYFDGKVSLGAIYDPEYLKK